MNISSKQEDVQQLIYQLKEINTSIKGGEFLTAATNGSPITAGQALNYGKNVWYYIPHQAGNHDIQLIAVSKYGTTKEATVSLDVHDPDFQLEIKPETTTIFSHEQTKLIINISSIQEGADKLSYQLKEVTTNIEAGQLSATSQGAPLSGQSLQYGRNVLYYTPHQSGKHTIQAVVAKQSTTKKATAVLTAQQATFSAEVKIEKPTKSADTTWEVRLLLRSSSGLEEEQWELAGWQIAESEVGKLQDVNGYQIAEKGVLLQSELNKFNLVFSEGIELKSIPRLKLTIRQPDGKDKLLVEVDLSMYVFAYLEKGMGLLIEQYKVACKKVVNKELLAQDKFKRVDHQLQIFRSSMNILAQSTTINRDQLEDVLTKTDPSKLTLSALFWR